MKLLTQIFLLQLCLNSSGVSELTKNNNGIKAIKEPTTFVAKICSILMISEKNMLMKTKWKEWKAVLMQVKLSTKKKVNKKRKRVNKKKKKVKKKKRMNKCQIMKLQWEGLNPLITNQMINHG